MREKLKIYTRSRARSFCDHVKKKKEENNIGAGRIICETGRDLRSYPSLPREKREDDPAVNEHRRVNLHKFGGSKAKQIE